MDYSPKYGRFRALLRKIREEAGLSQEALSAKLGEHQTFVSKSELGERRIDFVETLEFCAACNVPVEKFIERLTKSSPAGAEGKRTKRKSPRKMDGEGRLSH